jgi:replicative DNA helicase
MSAEKYILPHKPANYRTIGDMVGEAYENLANPIPSIPIPSLPIFSKSIGNIRGREFSILCGSTGVGKTTFLANLSASLLRDKIPHYVASVETGSLDYVRRVLSVLANRDINSGEAVDKKLLYSLHKQYGHIVNTQSLQLALYENRTTVEELMSDMTRAHKEHGARVAMIDNLNFFMEVTKSADSIVEMDRVVHELVIFCKQIDMHVILIMHPRKTTSGRVESIEDIKGSSLAVQEAHNVWLLNRPSQEDIDAGSCTRFDRELTIAKMRRYGRAVGRKIYFKSENGVAYQEKHCVE